MTKEQEALKLALEAIEELRYSSSTFKADKLSAAAITAIKQALAQPEERNFCPRCGKRTADIHTCTPPQENT
jgi:NADH pyrophosphatase NudC (nudix superfamily)